MKEKLGIIIPVFNVEEYLECCIESILRQTYKDWELILVDDASTDKSGYMCDAYALKDSRIKVKHFNENKGPIIARYEGVKYTEAKYVTFVDADDWLEPSIYEKMMESMEQHDVDILSTGTAIRYWDEKDYMKTCDSLQEGLYLRGEIESKVFPIMLWSEEKNLYGLEPSLGMKIFKKNLLLKQYDEVKEYRFHYAEDAAILYPYMLEVEKMYVLHEYGYFHRQRPRNTIAPYIKNDTFYEGLICLYKYLLARFKEEEQSESLLKQLNLFYIESVNLRKSLFVQTEQNLKYLFPFHRVNQDSRIVLYGAGKVGRAYYSQIEKLRYCKELLWVDKNYMTSGLQYVKPVEDMFLKEYDYVVVAVLSKESNDIIRQDLVSHGIAEDKIILYSD